MKPLFSFPPIFESHRNNGFKWARLGCSEEVGGVTYVNLGPVWHHQVGMFFMPKKKVGMFLYMIYLQIAFAFMINPTETLPLTILAHDRSSQFKFKQVRHNFTLGKFFYIVFLGKVLFLMWRK